MAYIERKVYSGKTVEVKRYHTRTQKSKGSLRIKREPTTEERQKSNLKQCEERLRWKLNTNFSENDLLVTLSYNKESGNKTRTAEQMKEDKRTFFKKLRKCYRNAGKELKFVYVAEIGPLGSRHHHAVLSGIDPKIIKDCWPYGFVDFKYLEKSGNYKKIAVCVILFVGICVSLGSNDDNPTENAVATTVNSVNEDDVIKKTTTKASTTEEPTTSPEEYKSSCDSVAYKDIARNPDQYNGKNVKFTGKVIQVQESYGNNVVYRISVTKNEYDFWDDTVYVTYKLPEGSPNILEDDIVTFYGECKGTKSYTTVLGSKVTIPEVDAKYIVIDKEG